MFTVPFFLRRSSDLLSAGFPSPAEGYEDEPLNLHTWIVRNPAATFFYRVRGDAFEGEHICHGAVLVIDRSRRPRRGELILVELHGVFSVARFEPGHPIQLCGVIAATVMRF